MSYELPLTQGLVAIVDDIDFVRASEHKWTSVVRSRTAYAQRTIKLAGGKQKSVLLHRQILGLTNPSVHVDHINGDGLDNRRSNLRTASITENNRNQGPSRRNTSGYKGVRFRTERDCWSARIFANGRTHCLGHFDNAEDAARAYDAAARDLHGEFAWTNLPLDPNYQGAK